MYNLMVSIERELVRTGKFIRLNRIGTDFDGGNLLSNLATHLLVNENKFVSY